MEKSASIKELATALCEFQHEMEPVIFDALNPYFKSKYATLAKLVSMAAPVHTKYGLSVSQLTEDDGAVTTILMHTSGEYLSSKLKLKPTKEDAQGSGAAITYSRRFSYAAILGLISEADDDGNKAADLKHKNEESHDPIAIQSKTLRETVDMMGENKFGGTDKFQIWRVDNDLPESLNGLSDFSLAKIMTAIREHGKVKK